MASAKDVEMTAHEETAEEHRQHVVERAQAGWRKVRAVKTVIGIRPWHKRHEKKIFLCGGFSATAVFVGIVALIATATAIAVVAAVLSDRAATAEEQALAKKQQSAAVNIAQRSVIPPKDENGDASRRLLSTTPVPRGLLRSVARSMERKLAAEGTSQFAADSDFNTQSTSIYVYDRLSDSLRTANQIICMLSSSEAETLFDDGPFTAIFDSASCLGSQNSDSTGESKKIQTATWVVVPTAPDVTAETGNFELDAWLKIPSPGPYGSDMNVDFHLEVPKDKFVTYNETINGETVQSVRAGDFTIKFRSARPNGGGYGTVGSEAGYGNDPGSSSATEDSREHAMQFEGILTNRIVGTTETMYFQMNGGQDANVEVIADISTGEGYSLSGSTRYDYASSECMEAEMATGDMSTAANMEAHENAIREACLVKLTDQVSFLDDLVAVAGDSVTNGSTQCMDRSGYVNLGDSYGLYDADGTEVRVTTDVSIKKQVRYKGKTGVVYGVISPGNMWLWADYDYETNTEIFTDDDIQGPIREQFFADGAAVQRNTWEWDPSTGMPAAYDPSAPTLTLKTVAGSMRVSAKVEKPLDEIDGIEFYVSLNAEPFAPLVCPHKCTYTLTDHLYIIVLHRKFNTYSGTHTSRMTYLTEMHARIGFCRYKIP